LHWKVCSNTLENGKLLQMALLLLQKYISIIFCQYSVLTQMLDTKVAKGAASAISRHESATAIEIAVGSMKLCFSYLSLAVHDMSEVKECVKCFWQKVQLRAVWNSGSDIVAAAAIVLVATYWLPGNQCCCC